MRAVITLVLAAGCGRIGFGTTSGGPGDGRDSEAGNVDGTTTDVVVPTLCPNATVVGPGTDPHLASNGATWGVTFRDGMIQRFASIDAAGAPSSSILINDGTGTNLGGPSAISARGSNFVIGYPGDGVHLQEVSPTGSLVGARVTVDPAVPARYPSFSIGGGPLRLTWLSYQAGALVVTTSELSTALAPTNAVQLTNSQSSSANARATWNGTNWAVYWDGLNTSGSCTTHSIYAHTVNANGTAASGQSAEPSTFDCTTSASLEHHRPQAVWNGNDYTFFWDPHADAGTTAIETVRMSSTYVLASTPTLATSATTSTHADLLANGSELALAWSGNGIYVSRLDPTGAPLGELTFDAAGITPSVAWDGTRYAVAYEKAGQIYFAAACP